MYEYEATDVELDEKNEALTVAFGGLPDADGCPTVYLILQRSVDENEDEQGIDGVYAEWCEQGMSCYGCIIGFDLYPEKMRVTFNEAADFYIPENEEQMTDEQRLTELFIRFSLDEKRLQTLKERLSFIFRECDCYFMCDSEPTIK